MGGGEAEGGGKDAAFVPPLVLLGFVRVAGFSGAMRGGRDRRMNRTPKPQTPANSRIDRVWLALKGKEGVAPGTTPLPPFEFVQDLLFCGLMRTGFPARWPQKSPPGTSARPVVTVADRSPQRRNLMKTRGGAVLASFLPPSASPPPDLPCLP
jgi:hypothetical protein